VPSLATAAGIVLLCVGVTLGMRTFRHAGKAADAATA
jgi:hypothetical protein